MQKLKLALGGPRFTLIVFILLTTWRPLRNNFRF
jgi:hypothetical protein